MNRDRAVLLLQHYFRMIAQRAGVPWNSDNSAEIESIVDAIIAAAREAAK